MVIMVMIGLSCGWLVLVRYIKYYQELNNILMKKVGLLIRGYFPKYNLMLAMSIESNPLRMSLWFIWHLLAIYTSANVIITT